MRRPRGSCRRSRGGCPRARSPASRVVWNGRCQSVVRCGMKRSRLAPVERSRTSWQQNFRPETVGETKLYRRRVDEQVMALLHGRTRRIRSFGSAVGSRFQTQWQNAGVAEQDARSLVERSGASRATAAGRSLQHDRNRAVGRRRKQPPFAFGWQNAGNLLRRAGRAVRHSTVVRSSRPVASCRRSSRAVRRQRLRIP